jgi:hypothetical protein
MDAEAISLHVHRVVNNNNNDNTCVYDGCAVCCVLCRSRGANLIPMDEMDGRLTVEAYHFMMKAAQDANYNTLRVSACACVR